MDKNYSKMQKILLHIIYTSLIFVLTNLISSVIEVELDLLTQLIIVVIISTLIKHLVKHPIFSILIFGICFLIMLFINSYKTPVFLPIANKMQPMFSNLIENIQGKEVILKENTPIIFILIVISISLYTSIVIYGIKKIFLLLPLYLPILLIYWYSFIDSAFNVTIVFIFLFLILLGFKNYRLSNFEGSNVLNRWLGTALIYSIIIVSIALVIPKTSNYISWPFLQAKVYDTFPMVEDLRYYKEYNRENSDAELFNFSISGFSESGSDLGGPLVQSERKVMTVESDKPVYLRGNVRHFYTGRNWQSKSTELEESKTKEKATFPSQSEKDLFFTEENIAVKFDLFSSETLFTPYKPISLRLNKTFTIFVDMDDIVTSDHGIYKNEGYSVEYIKPSPYTEMVNAGANRRKSSIDGLDFYLQVPEDQITDRTIELTSSLVQGLGTDYEKAIAIQNHLRDNYKYNLDVVELPEKEEFIDHFLFQEQEGYCTYYASSMAIMLRLEGIPTRYVEGYVANEKIGTNKYQVRQKHAHTWVEAFIEPVGWMNFEPTAAYEPLEAIIENDEENLEEDIEEDIVPEKEDPAEETTDDENLDIENEGIDSEIEIEKYSKATRSIFLASTLIFLSLITLRVLIRYLRYRKKEAKFSSLNNKDKILYLYKDILTILAILGFPIKSGETHFEYASRISHKLTDPKGYDIKDITSLFVELKYSDTEVTDKDILSFTSYKDLLDKKLKNNLGKFKYFYRKYIFIYFKKSNEIP